MRESRKLFSGCLGHGSMELRDGEVVGVEEGGGYGGLCGCKDHIVTEKMQ